MLIGKFDGSKFGKTRDNFMDIKVNKFRIRMITQYYQLYCYPMFKKMGFGDATCPNLEAYWDSSFSYPQSTNCTDEDISYMISSTKKAVAMLKKGF